MPVPLEDSLDEQAFEGEFAALPDSYDPLADLERGRRLQRTQRRRRAVALACVAAALATTGAGVTALVFAPLIGAQTGLPAGPVPTASMDPAPATSPSPTPTVSKVPPGDTPKDRSCTGTVQLVGPMGDVVPLTPDSTPKVRLRVGDLLRLETDGRCGPAVTLLFQDDSVLHAIDARTAKAVKVGSTRLSAGHAMCADLPAAHQPGCAGGLALDGQVDVVVVPS